MGEIHTFEAPQKFYGVEVGRRMTVIAVGDDLLLHSPFDVDAEQLEPLGRPRWALAPNRLHHLYIGVWLDRGLEGYAAPGLPEKRTDLKFDHVVEDVCEPFGGDILLYPMRSFPLTNEVVVFHRPSRTLVVTDLVFNFTKRDPWSTRFFMGCSGAYPGCRVSLLERFGMQRELGRREISDLLDLDFDRLIPAHGAIIETGGKDALRRAYDWLLPA